MHVTHSDFHCVSGALQRATRPWIMGRDIFSESYDQHCSSNSFKPLIMHLLNFASLFFIFYIIVCRILLFILCCNALNNTLVFSGSGEEKSIGHCSSSIVLWGKAVAPYNNISPSRRHVKFSLEIWTALVCTAAHIIRLL